MTVVVIRRTSGYTISIDGEPVEHVTDNQAHDLQSALNRALADAEPRTVTPAKWRPR